MQEKIVKLSPLFSGLSDKDYEYALDFFSAREVKMKKGDVLNRISCEMDYFGLVLEGTVQVYMDDMDGDQIIMASNGPGASFGEALCFLKMESPVYVVAMTDGSFLKMNTKRFDELTDNKLGLELKNRFIAVLAKRTLQMNNRIQILSKISIRDKLLTYFAECENCRQSCCGNEIEIPFNRNDMAIYLGVNRSALSRELSAMQEEGLIEFRKNKFRLLGLRENQ